jgi:hypothetical protein
MTKHDASEQSDRRGAGDEQERTGWGHSLATAAVCLGAAALIAILGWPG